MQTSSLLELESRSVLKANTVVALDDDVATLAALRRTLRGEPYILLTTDEPSRVLDWLESREVSLVMSDLRMPGRDGVEFLGEVWARSQLTLGVILTAYPEAVRGHSRLPRWVRRVIPKPWRDGWLRITLRHLLWERGDPRAGSAPDLDELEFDLGGEG
jgi:DNA-binding NtrC family response regulator